MFFNYQGRYSVHGDSAVDVMKMQKRLREFATLRQWEKFHSPKNLSMAVAAEAAELLEIFQWLTEEESREIVASASQMSAVREEIADVLIYLVRLADVLGIEIEAAVSEKMSLNERKYPIEAARGNAVKYNRR